MTFPNELLKNYLTRVRKNFYWLHHLHYLPGLQMLHYISYMKYNPTFEEFTVLKQATLPQASNKLIYTYIYTYKGPHVPFAGCFGFFPYLLYIYPDAFSIQHLHTQKDSSCHQQFNNQNIFLQFLRILQHEGNYDIHFFMGLNNVYANLFSFHVTKLTACHKNKMVHTCKIKIQQLEDTRHASSAGFC